MMGRLSSGARESGWSGTTFGPSWRMPSEDHPVPTRNHVSHIRYLHCYSWIGVVLMDDQIKIDVYWKDIRFMLRPLWYLIPLAVLDFWIAVEVLTNR